MGRKYEYYQVSNLFGVENYENYRDAVSVYNRISAPATLWGVTLEDDWSVIASKKN